MRFRNRADAGTQLAQLLTKYKNSPNTIVLGIPRGGIPVAYQVAASLQLPLDIFVSRKLGVPGHEEVAFGAVAADNGRYLDFSIIRATKLTAAQIEEVSKQVRATLTELTRKYRGSHAAPNLKGRTVILIDDGIATGSSIFAGVRALRGMGVARLIVGVPVAPRTTCAWLEREADELVVVNEPVEFYAVGEFYEDFRSTDDEEIIQLLARNAQERREAETTSIVSNSSIAQEVSIPMNGSSLLGILTQQPSDKGIVLFAHGSGSGRKSARNRSVAKILQAHGLSTLLFDLLTFQEDLLDQTSLRFRFDIGLLTQRLMTATEWIEQHLTSHPLPIFYFGASTGAAAALTAAARLGSRIHGVVSRGGRVDLAQEDLSRVKSPTLLIVGERDETVLAINRHALDELASTRKQIVIVPNASHLFEEEGALEKVATLAADWFLANL